MKWIFLTVLLSSSSLALMTLLALYWRRRRRLLAASPLLDLPVLDISEYKVIVLDEEAQCEAFFKDKMTQQVHFVGLDCEWVSSQIPSTNGYHPVALLQLAFLDKECVLVRLSKIGKITDSLVQLLTNKSCLKFGVGVFNDAARLTKGFRTASVGCVDLRNVALRCGIRRNVSLAGLTKQLTGYDLIKSTETTCSDWEQDQLTDNQILYAARDAIAGLMIFEKMVTQKIDQRRHWTIVEESILETDSLLVFSSEEGKACALSLCQGITDTDFKSCRSLTRSNQSCNHQTRTTAYNLRQTPLYHNCQLLSPDGTLLSTVDIKKVEWYLDKGLGVLESEDPPVLRLSFEPSGKPNKDREYYLTEKENICVVCGRSDSYIRKNIVPHEYRKFFPPKMKEHLSHDVLLLCVNCHQVSSIHDGLLRQQIASEYLAPLEASTQKYHEDSEKIKLRSLARAVSGDTGKLPEVRRKEIMQILADHLNCQPVEVTDEMIEELMTMETRRYNSDYVSHGELVVIAVQENGELIEFQQRWRQHFLDEMQPQHMPKLWSVYHNPSSTM